MKSREKSNTPNQISRRSNQPFFNKAGHGTFFNKNTIYRKPTQISEGNTKSLSKVENADNGLIQRMLACPTEFNTTDSLPDGFKRYYGNPRWFHCGFNGILEDRAPSPEDPQNECFYDHSGRLVDGSHPYSGCRGTPNDYDSSTSYWDHTFNDRGGIWQRGGEAWNESRRYFIDQRRRETGALGGGAILGEDGIIRQGPGPKF